MAKLPKTTPRGKASTRSEQHPNADGGQRQCLPVRRLAKGPETVGVRMLKSRKWRNKEIIILGGIRTCKHYYKWQQIGHRRWEWLLDIKRSTEPVVEDPTQFRPTTKRMQPSPRRKTEAAGAGCFT